MGRIRGSGSDSEQHSRRGWRDNNPAMPSRQPGLFSSWTSACVPRKSHLCFAKLGSHFREIPLRTQGARPGARAETRQELEQEQEPNRSRNYSQSRSKRRSRSSSRIPQKFFDGVQLSLPIYRPRAQLFARLRILWPIGSGNHPEPYSSS